MLFAYHEMGYACVRELLTLGAPIAALFTHRDSSGEQIWWHSCEEVAREAGVPVFRDMEGAELAEKTAALSPAIIYSFYYRDLLPESVLRCAPRGAFNLHGSLLPKYRGRAPVNWVLVNGESETGVTLHHMVARADAGDIVAQKAVAIDDSDTALTLYHKLVPLGAALVREFHPKIVAGRAPRIAQDISQGNYCGRRRPEDGRIDWTWPARRIFNLIRAVTHPYPGAFCEFDGRKLYVWEARLDAETGRIGNPGAILKIDRDAVVVATGQGTVAIVRAQLDCDAEEPATGILKIPASLR